MSQERRLLLLGLLLTLVLLVAGVALWVAFGFVADPDLYRAVAVVVLTALWCIGAAVLLGMQFGVWERLRPTGRPTSEPALNPNVLREVQAATASARRLPASTQGPRPWVLVIGPRGSGKSTALAASELPVERLDGGGHTRGPESVEWTVVNGAVFVDVPGRFTDDPEARSDWLALLGGLRRHLPEGISAVLVCVGIPQLLDANANGRQVMTDRLRGQLRDVGTVLGVRVPAHLLFTGLDSVDGTRAVFEGLASEARGQLFGFTLPGDAVNQARLVPLFDRHLEDLALRLEQHRMLFMVGEAKDPDWAGRYLLPASMRALGAEVSAFVGALGQGDRGNMGPLSGVWFASARSGGVRRSPVRGALHRQLGLVGDATLAPGTGGSDRPLFLNQLFSRVLSRPSTVTASALELERRRTRLRRALYASLAVAVIGVTPVMFVGVLNLRYTTRLETLTIEVVGGKIEGEPVSLATQVARDVVLADWMVPRWAPRGATDDDTWREWARSAARLERPPAMQLLFDAPARWGVGDAKDQVLAAVVERDLVAGALSIVRAELAKAIGGRPGWDGRAPMDEDDRRAALDAWRASQVAARMQAVQRPNAPKAACAVDGLDEDEGWLARSLADAAFSAQSATAESASARAAAVKLLGWWLGRPESCAGLGRSGSVFESVAAVDKALSSVGIEQLLYGEALDGVSVEMRGAPLLVPATRQLRVDEARSRVLAAGFTLAGCQSFHTRLEELRNNSVVCHYKGFCEDPRVTADAVRAAELAYAHDFGGGWEAWWSALDVEAPGEDLQQIATGMRAVFGDRGELSRALGAAGTPASDAAGPGAQTCACLSAPVGVASSLAQGGNLTGEYDAARKLFLDLAEDLDAAAADPEKRRELVHSTLDRGGLRKADTAWRRLADNLRALGPADMVVGGVSPDCARDSVNGIIADRLTEVGAAYLDAAWDALARAYVSDTNRRWEADVYEPWKRVAAKYPFTASANLDADPDEIGALLGPGGALDAIGKDLVDPVQGRPPPWSGAGSIRLLATAPFRTRAEVVGRLDGIAAGRRVGFVKGTGTTLNEWRLTVEGDLKMGSFNRANQREVEVEIRPGSEILFGASYVDGSGPPRDCGDTPPKTGVWAAWRVLEPAMVDFGRGKSAARLDVRTDGGCAMQWTYKDGTDGPLRQLRALRSLGGSVGPTLLEYAASADSADY